MTISELENGVKQAVGREISGFLSDGRKSTIRLDLSNPCYPAWDCWVGNVLTPEHVHWQAETIDELVMIGSQQHQVDILKISSK